MSTKKSSLRKQENGDFEDIVTQLRSLRRKAKYMHTNTNKLINTLKNREAANMRKVKSIRQSDDLPPYWIGLFKTLENLDAAKLENENAFINFPEGLTRAVLRRIAIVEKTQEQYKCAAKGVTFCPKWEEIRCIEEYTLPKKRFLVKTQCAHPRDPPNPEGLLLEKEQWKQLDNNDPGRYKVFVKSARENDSPLHNLADYARAIKNKKITQEDHKELGRFIKKKCDELAAQCGKEVYVINHNSDITHLHFKFACKGDPDCGVSRDRVQKVSMNISEDIKIMTWNVAGINNNPFEYYTTVNDDPRYERLMRKVEEFVENPGSKDIEVGQIFTTDMFENLKKYIRSASAFQDDAIEESLRKLTDQWTNIYQNKKIISEFLKDRSIGSKRLISMPDRNTNTLQLDEGKIAYRPSVINNYTKEMPSIGAWYSQWLNFFFKTELQINNESTLPYNLLTKINKDKYPAITDEESEISIPLQLLVCAIFDAILIHMLNTISMELEEPGAWMDIKKNICNKLVENKVSRTVDILLGERYQKADIIFLQEVSSSLFSSIQKDKTLNKRFKILISSDFDSVRDQNSIVLVATDRIVGRLPEEIKIIDIAANETSDKNIPISPGDIAAFKVNLSLGSTPRDILLVSFHGDTNGKASISVLESVKNACSTGTDDLPVIFGLDANTHITSGSRGQKLLAIDFVEAISSNGFSHSWLGSDPKNWITTRNARTYLQPQLNKAVKMSEKDTSPNSDINPKDFILFRNNKTLSFNINTGNEATRENTVSGEYLANLDMPSLDFPSDHAIVSTILTVTNSEQ